MSGVNLLSGINLFFPNAVVYTSNDSFWSSLKNFGELSFYSFEDSFLYYMFNWLTISVIAKFIRLFFIWLGVAYVSSLVFVWWLWSRSWIGWRVQWTFSSSKK